MAPTGSALQRTQRSDTGATVQQRGGTGPGSKWQANPKAHVFKGEVRDSREKAKSHRGFQGAFLRDGEDRRWLWPGYVYLSLQGHKEPPQSLPSLTPCSPGLGSLVSGAARTSQVCPTHRTLALLRPQLVQGRPSAFLVTHKPSCVTGPSLSYGSDLGTCPGAGEASCVTGPSLSYGSDRGTCPGSRRGQPSRAGESCPSRGGRATPAPSFFTSVDEAVSPQGLPPPPEMRDPVTGGPRFL